MLKGATEENDDWKVGHPLVFPYNMRVGGGGVHQMQIRVPINRTTTRFMLYTVHSPDGYEHVDQPQIPDYRDPGVRRAAAGTSPTTSRARTSWRG